jgi:hypothetical protein
MFHNIHFTATESWGLLYQYLVPSPTLVPGTARNFTQVHPAANLDPSNLETQHLLTDLTHLDKPSLPQGNLFWILHLGSFFPDCMFSKVGWNKNFRLLCGNKQTNADAIQAKSSMVSKESMLLLQRKMCHQISVVADCSQMGHLTCPLCLEVNVCSYNIKLGFWRQMVY